MDLSAVLHALSHCLSSELAWLTLIFHLELTSLCFMSFITSRSPVCYYMALLYSCVYHHSGADASLLAATAAGGNDAVDL